MNQIPVNFKIWQGEVVCIFTDTVSINSCVYNAYTTINGYFVIPDSVKYCKNATPEQFRKVFTELYLMGYNLELPRCDANELIELWELKEVETIPTIPANVTIIQDNQFDVIDVMGGLGCIKGEVSIRKEVSVNNRSAKVDNPYDFYSAKKIGTHGYLVDNKLTIISTSVRTINGYNFNLNKIVSVQLLPNWKIKAGMPLSSTERLRKDERLDYGKLLISYGIRTRSSRFTLSHDKLLNVFRITIEKLDPVTSWLSYKEVKDWDNAKVLEFTQVSQSRCNS